MKKRSKKPNPRNAPASKADVKRAKIQAKDEAISIAWAIMLSVLRDKEGYGVDDLGRVWQEVEYLSDSVVKGIVTVADLKTALKEEAGIILD